MANFLKQRLGIIKSCVREDLCVPSQRRESYGVIVAGKSPAPLVVVQMKIKY